MRLANGFANSLVEKGVGAVEHQNHYEYFLDLLIGKALTYGSLILVGLFTGMVGPTLIYTLFLTSLRSRTGGYHAKSRLRCYLASVGIYLVCLLLYLVMPTQYLIRILTPMLLLSCIFIIAYAPVNHPNLRLSASEIRKCRRTSRYVLAIEICILGILMLTSTDAPYLVYGSFATIVAGIAVLLGKLTKQEVSNDEWEMD